MPYITTLHKVASASIFVGNNTGNSVDILSLSSFLLAREPHADAYEMHGHVDITYVMSRGGKRSPGNKACDAPICPCFSAASAGGINPGSVYHVALFTRDK